MPSRVPQGSDALLVGEPKPDLSARGARRVLVVAEAQVKWQSQPILRIDAGGGTRRYCPVIRRYANRRHWNRSITLLRMSKTARIRLCRHELGGTCLDSEGP